MSYLCSIFVFVFFFLAMLVHMSVIWKITRKNICRSKLTQRPRFKPQVKHLNRKIWKNISTGTSSFWLPAKTPWVNKIVMESYSKKYLSFGIGSEVWKAMANYVRGVIKKITVIFQFHELLMFDFRIFSIILVHIPFIYMLIISATLDCQLVFHR